MPGAHEGSIPIFPVRICFSFEGEYMEISLLYSQEKYRMSQISYSQQDIMKMMSKYL